jgi:hypothetical protein
MMHLMPGVRFAVLMSVALVVIAAGPGSAVAQEGENPAWLVPGASYTGVWKTVGANSAPDLDSQFTLGYKGPDGNVILLTEDGRLAVVYGVNSIGAPNHSEQNILTTRTPDGFRFGTFDPSRNSAEFTCVMSEDGAILTCARHAMFSGREYFNNVEMTRVATGGGG